MTDTRVASRYAKSLLDLAIEKGILDKVYQDMQMFADVCSQNSSFVLMLKNPVVPHHKKKSILSALFKNKVNPATMAIFDVIARKNREAFLPSIATEFARMYREEKGIDKVVVTTTFPLTDDLRKRFKQNITAQTGRQVDLTEKIDPDLIGGFIIKIGDRQMDNSVRSKLKSLMYEFTDDSYIKSF